MKLSDVIVQTYPYPLATAAKRFNDATEHMEGFMCLANLFEVSLKYLASIGLAQYLRVEDMDEGIQRELEKLPRPTLGVWDDILRTCMRFYAGNQDRPCPVPELRDGYAARLGGQDSGTAGMRTWLDFMAEYLGDKQRRRSLQHFLCLMVLYRNKTWGHGIGQLTPELCEEHTEHFLPGLQGMLETIGFLTRYPLRYVKEVRKSRGRDEHVMFDYMGTTWQQGATYVGEYAQERRLYLCSEEGAPLLSLHPLFVVHQRRLYVLEYYEREEDVGYSDCETGKSFEAGGKLSSLNISKLAGDRHHKLGDTELPVPPERDGLEIDESFLVPSLAELLDQLDEEGRQVVQMAQGEAVRIGHFWLGVEFLLMGLSRQPGGLLPQLLAAVGVEPGNLRGVLRGMPGVRNQDWRQQRGVEAIGAKALPDLREIDPATLASLYDTDEMSRAGATPRMMAVLREAARQAGDGKIAPLHLLLAALQHPQCTAVQVLLGEIGEAGHDPMAWLAGVQQQAQDYRPQAGPVGPGEIPGAQPPLVPRGKGVLDALGRDLTALAEKGKLRPAIGEGAHKAMVQMGLILQQTQANNPILLGDPGVGKTAIVEGFAWRLAVGAQHGQPVIPALANKRIVDLSPVGLRAGTKYRGDLEERLQKLLAEVRAAAGQTIVFVDEIHSILGSSAGGDLSTVADALKPGLARGEFPCIGTTTVAEYRRHIESDPALARRFTPVWIEEPSVEEAIQIVKEVAQRHLGPGHNVEYPGDVVEEAVQLAVRYLHDEFLPGKAIKLLDQAGPRALMGGSLRGVEPGDEDTALAPAGNVTAHVVREIVSERTGIPLTRLSETQAQRLLCLEDELKERVKGQDEAVAGVARVVKRARAGLADPRRPLGVFLFAGPTGVGKTELALALAQALFGEEEAILRLDMSEYMEKHQVSRLIGSPPGYVGYEEAGQLTGRLRRDPYCVVLLDEMEKAHLDVQHLFLQLFDAGRLTDARGKLADGRNAIFVMTTNLGAREALGFIDQQQPYREKLQAPIEAHFTPEFLNRVDRIVYFDPLSEQVLLEVFDKLFARIQERFQAQDIKVELTDSCQRRLCQEHTDQTTGARQLQRAIEDQIVAPLTDKVLAGEIGPGMTVVVRGVGDFEYGD